MHVACRAHSFTPVTQASPVSLFHATFMSPGAVSLVQSPRLKDRSQGACVTVPDTGRGGSQAARDQAFFFLIKL